MDVKDYFMSGDAMQLVDDAVKIADDKPELKNLLRRALDLLLSCQYVASKECPERLWKTLK